MNDASKQPSKRRWLSAIFNALLCVAILAASAAAIVVINQTEPTAQQINTTRKSAALVDTIEVRRGDFSPKLVVLGTVQAAQQIVLSPRVGGQVVELSEEFVPGGMVSQGDLLLRIDPADFENAVSIRESELQQAEASLEIEEGRQNLAEKELALLGESIDETNRALVLRQPQYASIKAEVSAAKAAVRRAKLDFERSSIRAPFDAQILSRSVNIGSQVAPGDELGQLVGIEEYWILAAVPVRSLRWVQFPEKGVSASQVLLRNADAWGPGVERVAQVTRMIGALDEQTRLARVLVTVPDPLGRKSNAPALILDTLMEVEIEGRLIENVVRLSRDYIRDRDTAWVMKDGKLEIRECEIVFRDAEYAYVSQGLEDGEEVVITTLATVADGVGLRKVDEANRMDSPSSEPPSSEASGD
ncbi:MAG: efflux RND transporter periplasmic adaptor subunit [bacterium]|nr:efflux RND transporter periplasmic adaptor subunit [bacterium]